MSGRKVAFSWLALLLAICSVGRPADAGIIKDLFQKVTHTNNKTEKVVQESVPICGSGIFSTPNEGSLSPELIFISTSPSRVSQIRRENSERRNKQAGSTDNQNSSSRRSSEQIEEISREFRFHAGNVTIEELERHGFNRDAPVSFLIHGFTSGYPLQAWISAIVEAYTIERETNSARSPTPDGASNHGHGSSHKQEVGREPALGTYESVQDNYPPNSGDQRERSPNSTHSAHSSSLFASRNSHSPSAKRADHNLIIVNWNYAARGILYPRAVANIPIVASYVTRFINDKLIDEARVDPARIQLIGHSLGAHVAGFVGKNSKSKLARIYGLDPAGPCFGALAGPLYPASKRLAPSDAREVVTVQTNSALLGIEKPLGKYSVFVEGGANQPGCRPSGVLKSIGTLTWDGGDFDTVACSHSRAPNLLTYRHHQADPQDGCQMVAYACKDWQSFLDGQCGVCADEARSPAPRGGAPSPLTPVECYRIGLDWQYPTSTGSHRRPQAGPARPSSQASHGNSDHHEERYESHAAHSSSSIIHHHERRPNEHYSASRRPTSSGAHGDLNQTREGGLATENRKPGQSSGDSHSSDRQRRDTNESREKFSNSSLDVEQRRAPDDQVEPVTMFLRTSDTQPYCTFHYQVVLELTESLGRKKPSMSIILQDSQPDARRGSTSPSGQVRGSEQNSLSSDQFGNKFDEHTYTHLLTSGRKLARIDHAVLIFREGLPDGHRKLKMIYVNYMSHKDARVRERLSSRLCAVRAEDDRSQPREPANNRFYFKPCGPSRGHSFSQDSQHGLSASNNQQQPNYSQNSDYGSSEDGREQQHGREQKHNSNK